MMAPLTLRRTGILLTTLITLASSLACNRASQAEEVAEGFASLANFARGLSASEISASQEATGDHLPATVWSFYCEDVSFVGGARLQIELDPSTGAVSLDRQIWVLGAPLCDDSTLRAEVTATALDANSANWEAKGKLLKKGGKDCDFDFTAVFSTETGMASSVSGTLCGRDIEKYDLQWELPWVAR